MIVYHPVGRSILLRYLLTTGTGAGVTGASPIIKIRRRSDNSFWTGTAWQSAVATIALAETDNVNLPGDYSYAFNQATAGNVPEEYLVRYELSTPFVNIDEEQHVFVSYAQGLAPQQGVGLSLSEDGVTLYVALWGTLGGVRQTNLTSIAAQLKDAAGDVIVDLGSQTSQSADGVFSFTNPVAALQRNLPYLLTAQVLIGVTTYSFNLGFVRI